MITLSVDLHKLKECGLSINEYLTLLKIKHPNIDFSFSPIHYKNVMLKGYITMEKSKLVVTELGESIINDYTENAEDSIGDLAEALRELYPSGKKGGTYYWRGSRNEIKKKLHVFYKKHGTDYTSEQILDATKRYINSFDDNDFDKAMMLLKYFIEKNGTSTLHTHLETITETKKLTINYGNVREL